MCSLLCVGMVFCTVGPHPHQRGPFVLHRGGVRQLSVFVPSVGLDRCAMLLPSLELHRGLIALEMHCSPSSLHLHHIKAVCPPTVSLHTPSIHSFCCGGLPSGFHFLSRKCRTKGSGYCHMNGLENCSGFL